MVQGEAMSNLGQVLEIVKWRSNPQVSDEEMIAAVDAMVVDLKKLNGFLDQTLYKNHHGDWIDIYYWETEKDAHDSNTRMADKETFKNLIALIDTDSVSIEIMHPLQTART